MEEAVVKMIQGVLAYLGNIFSDIQVHLQTAPEAFGGGGVWDTVVDINRGIQGIGYGILLCLFLMSFFKVTTNFRDLSLQQIIGWVVRFLITKALIDYGVQLLNILISISLGATDAVFESAGGLTMSTDVPPEVLAAIENMQDAAWYERIGAFFQTLPMMGLALISMLIIWVSGIVLVVCVYLRFFKVFVLSALSPLPLAAFGSPDTTNIGINFIKNYLGVCLEVTVIAVALVVHSSLVTSSTWVFPSWSGDDLSANAEYWNTMINYIFTTVLQTVMLVITVMSASRMIKELFGN